MIKKRDQEWFDKLHERNSKASEVFMLPEYTNVFRGVIDKYSDSAHFIYELLQNADDAGATSVSMELQPDKFIFTHNGLERFSISDPDKIEEDRRIGQLGHLNSICYIGYSSKSGSDIKVVKDAKIGKFGVGFKAVFQYTSAPEIYDNPFCFKIENYIVPTLIDGTKYQKRGKTVFVIPFDRKDIRPETAFREIYQKLKDLKTPQLFLNNVREVTWNTPTDNNKRIRKKLEISGQSHNVEYGLYSLNSDIEKKKRILLLSRKVKVLNQGWHDIMIGYYIENGKILTNTRQNIHCFFPTTESVGTCYVIHAPFALVDNRQQIKRNNEINEFLFGEIAKLAADSLLILRDWGVRDKSVLLSDNIVDLIRYDIDLFDKSFSGQEIKETFRRNYKCILDNEAIYRCRNGKYLTKIESWWADEDTQKLFSDLQIEQLTKLSVADNPADTYGFVLCGLNYKSLSDSRLNIDRFEGEEIGKRITSQFMSSQSVDWLERFYAYVIRKRLVSYYEINKGNNSKAPMRTAPIIKVESGNFVCAYNPNGELQVFYSNEASDDINAIVNKELMDKSLSFRNLLKELGVKTPDPIDCFRLRIEHQKELDRIENNKLIASIIEYWRSCDVEGQKNLIELIRKKFLFYGIDISIGNNSLYWVPFDLLYKDDVILRKYFKASGLEKKYFIEKSQYKEAIEVVGGKVFDDFLSKLEFKERPEYQRKKTWLGYYEKTKRKHTRITDKQVCSIEGLENILYSWDELGDSKELSHFIWELICFYHHRDNIFENDKSTYVLYKTEYVQDWGSCSMLNAICRAKWLYINGEYRCLSDIYKEDLIANDYACDDRLMSELNIESKPNIREENEISNMSKETRETFALGQIAKKLGIASEKDFEEKMAEFAALKKEKGERIALQKQRQLRTERRRQNEEFNGFPVRERSKEVLADDFNMPDNDSAKLSQHNSMKSAKNLDEILEGFEEKVKIQRDEIEQIANFRERIGFVEKYSYEWLLLLMQLEVSSQGTQGASGKKSLYVAFDRLTLNPHNEKMIVLSDASRYVPMSLEEMDTLPITFVFKNNTQEKLCFDSVSVKEDCIILKCGNNSTKSIELLKNNVNNLSYAYLEVNEPIEIITEWQNRIKELNFAFSDSVKANLRSDIEFIFGPPGTGKTTVLANRINDLINGTEQELKILVLAPTNKACDVLTRKLFEVCDGNDKWIWRFEKTDDSFIEDEELVYKRHCQINAQKKVCVISTIARYAFDGFADGELRVLDWDYVFIDEASMIPLYEILPPVYNCNSKRIIISGDPFQIEPIVNIDIWQGENIYKMINLQDFAKPITEPLQYDVTTLMTQYRSIPVIGELFSNYLYGGKLLHNKTEEQHRILHMGIDENPLNIITFPVGKESIFDLKRLSKSNIQVYSVLFTVEFLKYISKNIFENHRLEAIKIGVISPYSAEIQAIQKIYNQSCQFYENIDVIFGSAHGFQGDQCDIVIAVMNPPASGLKRAADMTFINNANILNVAISRASDYFFLLIPGKEYECFNSLYEIKKIGRQMMALRCKSYTSDELEQLMFGEPMHIERNTYVTSHKMTNVFNSPFTKYEIRIDENAIDVQINDV